MDTHDGNGGKRGFVYIILADGKKTRREAMRASLFAGGHVAVHYTPQHGTVKEKIQTRRNAYTVSETAGGFSLGISNSERRDAISVARYIEENNLTDKEWKAALGHDSAAVDAKTKLARILREARKATYG